jgi:hypothetical protein
MSENTLTTAAIATAAAKQAPRVAGNIKQEASAKTKRVDRTKLENFDETKVMAYQDEKNHKDVGAAWVSADGKTPDKMSSVEIEYPPFMIGGGSKIFGEGDAFTDVKDKKGVKISRGSAHFRLGLVQEVSDEMHEIYPEWRQLQALAVDKARKASIKLITDSFNWKHPFGFWEAARQTAWTGARRAIVFPGKEDMDDIQIDDHIESHPELKTKLYDLALNFYIKDSRYPFKPRMNATTKQYDTPVVGIESKVYASADYKEETHNNENKGPDETVLPSKNENMPEIIAMMMKLPAKGDKGIDARTYIPIKFVNKMAKRKLTKKEERHLRKEAKKRKEEEKAHAEAVKLARKEGKEPPPPLPPIEKPLDPISDRPTVMGKDGTMIPDYWFNPTTMQNGRQVRSYGTCIGGFNLTASELGGYGVKQILKNGRKIYIYDYEDKPDREVSDYGKRLHENDRLLEKKLLEGDEESDESSESEDENEKNKKHTKTGGEEFKETRDVSTANTTTVDTHANDGDEVDDELVL